MTDLFSYQSQSAPGIVPERIREAREARAFTSEEFAELIGVSRQALAQYELGQTRPRPEILSKIVGETAQPLSFFTTEKRFASPNMGHPFWRSLKRTTQNFRNRTVRRLEWALEITKHVEKYIDLPDPNLPEITFDVDWPEEVWTEEVEKAANAVRRHWGLGLEPIEHFERHLEANGIILVRDKVLTDDMDAVSRWQAGRPYILYAEESASTPRILYNLAHELGHIVLHAGVDESSKNLGKLEKQATRFAGAFLLPQKTFSKEALRSSLNHFIFLKSRWRVSISAMVYRAKDLGILSENQARYLWKQMTAEGIRKKEPLDDTYPIPSPSLLKEAINMILENSVETKTQLKDAIAINADDIVDLIAEAPGFFGPGVVSLDLSPRTANDNE